MTDTPESAGPLGFAANFPPDERFAATAGELGARLAAASGCAPDAADAIRDAVDAAFRIAVAAAGAGGSGVDVMFRTTGGAFDADVARGHDAFLHCSKPRSG